MSLKMNALGIMTGTSGDGADIALTTYLVSKGAKISDGRILRSASRNFPSALRKKILQAQQGKISIKDYGALTQDYSAWIAHMVCDLKKSWNINSAKTVVGVHGQTVWHKPPGKNGARQTPGFTMQMIDPSYVAQRSGLVTVSHFRQPDMAMGGHGAPLAPMYHDFLVRQGALKSPPPVAVNNLGGISNVTYVGKTTSELMAFDTGPANALIDMAVEHYTKGKRTYDHGGRLARAGDVNWPLIQRSAKQSYFLQSPPKSTGRELFNKEYLKQFKSTGLNLIADATAFTAWTVVDSYIRHLPRKGRDLKAVYLCGGGAKNPALVSLISGLCHERISQRLQVYVMPQSVGGGPSYTEACAFGYLAVRALLGLPVSAPSVTGAIEQSHGAAIYGASSYRKLLPQISQLF